MLYLVFNDDMSALLTPFGRGILHSFPDCYLDITVGEFLVMLDFD